MTKNRRRDQKIQYTALRYIRKNCLNLTGFSNTLIGEVHPEIRTEVPDPAELPIISFFHTPESWFLFTTRRVVGVYLGQKVDLDPLSMEKREFGNFKGYGGIRFEIMSLFVPGQERLLLEYETGKASMAPIYYFRYWDIKYPVLEKLKDPPQALPKSVT